MHSLLNRCSACTRAAAAARFAPAAASCSAASAAKRARSSSARRTATAASAAAAVSRAARSTLHRAPRHQPVPGAGHQPAADGKVGVAASCPLLVAVQRTNRSPAARQLRQQTTRAILRTVMPPHAWPGPNGLQHNNPTSPAGHAHAPITTHLARLRHTRLLELPLPCSSCLGLRGRLDACGCGRGTHLPRLGRLRLGRSSRARTRLLELGLKGGACWRARRLARRQARRRLGCRGRGLLACEGGEVVVQQRGLDREQHRWRVCLDRCRRREAQQQRGRAAAELVPAQHAVKHWWRHGGQSCCGVSWRCLAGAATGRTPRQP
jgi:hypothetical protein